MWTEAGTGQYNQRKRPVGLAKQTAHSKLPHLLLLSKCLLKVNHISPSLQPPGSVSPHNTSLLDGGVLLLWPLSHHFLPLTMLPSYTEPAAERSSPFLPSGLCTHCSIYFQPLHLNSEVKWPLRTRRRHQLPGEARTGLSSISSGPPASSSASTPTTLPC